MAIELKVTKEIGNYESKVFFGLTLRQLLSLLIAAPAVWFIYSKLSPYMSRESLGFVCMAFGAIPCAFGFVKPYGMPTEKFLKSIFINRILAPQKRKYKTANVHDKYIKNLETQKEEAENVSGKDKKKEKAIKYRMSPEAIK